jgi:hypothetical protein
LSAVSSRLFPRYRFNELCKAIVSSNGIENEIQARDISPTGIAFFGDGSWNIGDLVTVNVVPFGDSHLKVQAKIVRMNKEAGKTVFGAQFLSFPLLYQERLHQLIRSAIFKDQIDQYASRADLGLKLDSQQLVSRLLWTFFVAVSVFVFYQLLSHSILP